MVEGERRLPQVILWPTLMCHVVCIATYTKEISAYNKVYLYT